ncbi:MAG: phosphonate ABC transporter, permease protein PhnE, partial [Pseudomonadota bacterium]|nr:phosphonate ABC transporter, permease protein PhnE [Pseudomonadota bacterium]
MTDASTKPGVTAIPNPPSKSLGAWALDILIWGGVGAALVYSFAPVDLAGSSRLFSNSEATQDFARELLKPDFTDWRIFVAKMWE